jgi:hypothetical protein
MQPSSPRKDRLHHARDERTARRSSTIRIEQAGPSNQRPRPANATDLATTPTTSARPLVFGFAGPVDAVQLRAGRAKSPRSPRLSSARASPSSHRWADKAKTGPLGRRPEAWPRETPATTALEPLRTSRTSSDWRTDRAPSIRVSAAAALEAGIAHETAVATAPPARLELIPAATKRAECSSRLRGVRRPRACEARKAQPRRVRSETSSPDQELSPRRISVIRALGGQWRPNASGPAGHGREATAPRRLATSPASACTSAPPRGSAFLEKRTLHPRAVLRAARDRREHPNRVARSFEPRS